MKVKIQNWDNGCAIRLNRKLIEKLGVEVGSVVEVEVKRGGLLLKSTELTVLVPT